MFLCPDGDAVMRAIEPPNRNTIPILSQKTVDIWTFKQISLSAQ
jgi:hypothetical protein